MSFSRRSKARWAVPATALVSIVGISSISHLVAADAQVPNLPPLTAAELLVKVSTAKVPPLSGTIALTTNLGLPDLGGFGGAVPGSITDLFTGNHAATVASDGPSKIRVTMTGPNAESSWIRNGADAWSWNSTTQTASHATIGPRSGTTTPDQDTGPSMLSPAVAATTALAAVDPSTTVSVRTSAYVAGRAAYELVLSPKSASSTVAEVVLAIDGATGTPLDVKITAKGATKPAIELGFTAVSFTAPAASTFQFTPPAGVTVKEVASVSELLPFSRQRHLRVAPAPGAAPGSATRSPSSPTASRMSTTTVGTGWDSVLIVQGATISPQIATLLGGGTSIPLPGGGSARVVSTALVNVLLVGDGRIAIGAVTPSALVSALSIPPTAA